MNFFLRGRSVTGSGGLCGWGDGDWDDLREWRQLLVFSVEAADTGVRGLVGRGWFGQWGARTRWTRVGGPIVVTGSEEGPTVGVSSGTGAANTSRA